MLFLFQPSRMQKPFLRLTVAAILSAACASARLPAPSSSEPQTSSSTTENQIRGLPARSWHFKFRDETHSYASVTQTTIQSINNLPSSIDTFTTRSHFSITVDRQQTPSVISGEVTQMEIVPGQRVHNKLPIASAFAFTGSITSGQVLLHLSPVPADTALCNNPAASYLSELHAGVLSLPSQIQTGSSWSDTLSTTTCSGNRLPFIAQTIRLYQVQGITQEANLQLLLIKRTEQIRLSGAGSQDQHQIKVRGTGSGSADLFLNSETGTLQAAQVSQSLDFTLLTSGKSYQFRQATTQRIDFVR
jgi:hypothetical protein